MKPPTTQQKLQQAVPLHQQGKLAQARKLYEEILASEPDNFHALHLLGVVALQSGQRERAIELFRRAIAINSRFAPVHDNLGIALKGLGRPEEALASHDRAIALDKNFADAHFNRAHALIDLRRFEQAVASFDQAISRKPGLSYALGTRLHTKMRICDWRDWHEEVALLVKKVEAGQKASSPYALLSKTSSRAVQHRAARGWVLDRHPPDHSLPAIGRRARRDRIKVGYFSPNFENHATAFLMAELFEKHDRSRFEIVGLSFGKNTADDMRRRLTAAFDAFVDINGQTDREVALEARKLELDIAVDLNGFQSGPRAGIFARRAAPLQVNYLVYPGTMGADYIDYLIADPTLIPAAHRADYSEKIVYLPDCYQPNDSKRRISERVFSRQELGLPPDRFVFCSFNNNFKITPDVFEVWMRILRAVPGSVLWLLEDNEVAAANLRREAVQRGVDGGRLVFAPRMALPEHLARHRVADLFLDTLPYNGHTTVSDALWAGLPVLTQLGETFAGRVAASLLKAIDLPELIVPSSSAFEALAVELATDPGRLQTLKRRLADNRLTTPLFDIAAYTRHLEAAYRAMHDRHHAGLAPDHLVVAR